MNCRDALRLLYDVIDKEAEAIDSAEVEKHLQKCRHCLEKFEFEQMFRTFVTEKSQNTRDTSPLRDKILTRLDAIDAAGEVGASRPPFRWAAVGLASAAALVICIAAAFLVSGYYRNQAEFTPFVKAHYASADSSSPESLSVDPYDYLYEKTGIRLAPGVQWPADRIQSITVDTIKGVPFGRIDMTFDDGSPVTVFVARSDKYTLPLKPVKTIDGHRVVVYSCEKCNMIGRAFGDLVFMVVGRPNHHAQELDRLVSAY